jgi:TetR/AcrR family transcriptional regulator, transcriptional repressor for nem operon
VFEVLRDYRQRVIDSQFRYRCPIGSLALEVANEDGAARALIAENFAGWRRAIQRCLDDAGLSSRRVDKAALATFVLSVMEGGVMQALALRTIEPFDRSVEQLRNYLNLLRRDAIARGLSQSRQLRKERKDK